MGWITALQEACKKAKQKDDVVGRLTQISFPRVPCDGRSESKRLSSDLLYLISILSSTPTQSSLVTSICIIQHHAYITTSDLVERIVVQTDLQKKTKK